MDNSYFNSEWEARGKDSPTEATIARIEEIMEKYRFGYVYEPLEPRMNACFCASLKTDGFNSNGKGASPDLCKASAFGETMERFQNKKLNISLKYFDEYFKASEAVFPARPLTGNLPDCVETLITQIVDSLGSDIDVQKRRQLVDSLIAQITFSGNYVFRPFFSVKKHCQVDLPVQFLQIFTGTNGMAAGNTYEEAIVQGLCEIFERYAVIRIIVDQLTPPRIPDEEIDHYPSIRALMEKIEAEGNYEVCLYDASLGKGLPCVMCVIMNRETQTFGVKVGAHPQMIVAMERCFTEALQGWSLEQFSKASTVSFLMDGRQAWSEIRNILKISKGNFPPSLFGKIPSWTFSPRLNCEGVDNKTLLSNMVSLVEKLGGDMYVQNVAFLGFPAVYIYIAGVSEVVSIDYLWLKETQLLAAADRIFCNLDSVTEKDVDDLINLAKMRRNYIMCNTVNSISNSAYQVGMPGEGDEMGLLAAACCYKLGKDSAALSLLKNAPRTPYFNALKLFLNSLEHGLNMEQARHLVTSVAENSASERVLSDFKDRDGILGRLYPNCKYDCLHCDIPCRQNEVRKTYMKLLEADCRQSLRTETLQQLFQ